MTTTNDLQSIRYPKWGEWLPKWGEKLPIWGVSATKKYPEATKIGFNSYPFGVSAKGYQNGAKSKIMPKYNHERLR